MGRKLDKWSTALTAALVLGALLACKKKKAAEDTADAAAAVPVASAEPAAPAPSAEEVKRYGADEIAESGTVRVKSQAKVYREADTTSQAVISLAPGTLVNRVARKGTFLLIEYPTGVGDLTPGWVESHLVETRAVAVKLDGGIVKSDAGTAKADAGVKDAGAATAKDAGTAPKDAGAAAVVDAGGSTAQPDAGRVFRRIPRLGSR